MRVWGYNFGGLSSWGQLIRLMYLERKTWDGVFKDGITPEQLRKIENATDGPAQ